MGRGKEVREGFDLLFLLSVREQGSSCRGYSSITNSFMIFNDQLQLSTVL